MNKGRLLWWVTALLLLPLILCAGDIHSITRVLRHRDVRSLLARVSDELGPGGKVSIDRKMNSIRITDEEDHILSVIKLLDQLDQPARHFALSAKLEVLKVSASKLIFNDSTDFVDATTWAKEGRPTASFDCLADLYEGEGSSCELGSYNLTASVAGYDPTSRRLSLSELLLTRKTEDGSMKTLIKGRTVLTEGSRTTFLMSGSDKEAPLRLRIKPTLLPTVKVGDRN